MSAHIHSSPLTVYQRDPLNAGTPLNLLRRAFLTPNELFFIRAHGPLPRIDQNTYRLVVNGMVQRPLELSFTDLLTRFTQYTVTATLVCAGNRRSELAEIRPLPGEILWHADPLGTARWRGVRLSEVLQAAGIEAQARYAAFRGLDIAPEEGQPVSFGGSIQLEKALSPEVLLAFEMNDAPLPPEHGFPVRVLIPGYIGARSVKWLQEITLQSQPSTNYFQDRDYKLFPPEVNAETVDWSQGQPLEKIALNSVICIPQEGKTCPAGPTSIQGYAITGENVPITRVELSLNRGATWIPTTITAKRNAWSWCFWEATLDLPAGDAWITVRAWDASGRTQPEQAHALWNFKGYANNAWHQIHIHLA